MKTPLLLIAALCVTGCTAPVETKVTRFHRLPARGSGQTFAMLPPKGAGEIELSGYNAQIASHLENYGWRRTDPTKAKIGVAYEFGISAGREVQGSIPVMGQTGGGTTFHSGTYNTYGASGTRYGTVSGTSYTAPTYGVVGAIPYSRTLYDRFLLINAREKGGPELFDISCRSTGKVGTISSVVPAMIDSAFAEFPGESGKTKGYSRPLRQ